MPISSGGNVNVSKSIVALWLFSLVFTLGCDEPKVAPDVPTLSNKVTVTNYPLFEMVRSLAGDCIDLVYVGPDREDQSDWSPATSEIRELQKSDLIVVNGPGAEFAKWLAYVTVDKSKLCKSADVLAIEEFIVVDDFEIVHSHGPEGEHSHKWVVPHTWLDPSITKRQIEFISKRLVDTYPEHQVEFESNLSLLNVKLDKLIEQTKLVRAKSEKLTSRTVLLSDPRLTFLSRAVGLSDHAFFWFQPPDEKEAMEDFEKVVSAQQPIAMIWAGENNESAKMLESAISSKLDTAISLSVLEAKPDSGDYFKLMEANISKLDNLVSKKLETE